MCVQDIALGDEVERNGALSDGYPRRTSTTCALRETLPPSPEGVPGDRWAPNVSEE